eukprot:m.867957 g.867957  ORF g.867957 m.867957 type:complete len:535 (+) comp23556_c1_seq7:20-1624(+)
MWKCQGNKVTLLKSSRGLHCSNHATLCKLRQTNRPIPVVEENTSEMSGKTPFDLEPADVKKDRHKSIKCILFSNFLSATGFSILLSTMWPYLREQTDPSYKKDLGYVVAAFSVGQVIGAPFWGNYCVKRPYAETMHLTIIMRLLGNMLYFFITVLPLGHAGKFHVFLASRLLTGFGAGSMAVCNAYIAGGTYLPERAHFLGLLGATGGLGFVVGYAIGSGLGKLPTFHISEYFVIDFMNAPALLAALLCVVNIIILICSFEEHIVFGDTKKKTSKNGNSQAPGTPSDANSIQNGDDSPPIPKEKPNRDVFAVVALLLVYFGNMFVMSLGETLAVPLTMDEYNWKPQSAVVYNGIIAAATGVQSVVVFTQAKTVAAKIGDRNTLMLGLVLIFLADLAGVPYSGDPLDPPNNATNTFCLEDWCQNTPRLSLAQYLCSVVLFNFGFPFAAVMTFTIYSKVLGPFHQGPLMGLLNACGSLARVFGPMVITNCYSYGGPLIIYLGSAGLAAVVLLFTFGTYSRLVPYGTRQTTMGYHRI